jgi:hypothetical protein
MRATWRTAEMKNDRAYFDTHRYRGFVSSSALASSVLESFVYFSFQEEK